MLILYRAGRTAAGAKASASHTASIAGDYPVTKALFSQAGAVVVDSLEEFDDALTTFTLLLGKRSQGRRLGAVSNAGFECVAIADNLGALELASFSPDTGRKLEAVFAKAKVSEIVDVHNPIDLTPSSPDFGYDESFRAVLEDPGVDCGIVGIVPLTPAMNTPSGRAGLPWRGRPPRGLPRGELRPPHGRGATSPGSPPSTPASSTTHSPAGSRPAACRSSGRPTARSRCSTSG